MCAWCSKAPQTSEEKATACQPEETRCFSPHASLALQKKYERADELFMEAIAIEEKTLGPEHPDHAKTLNNRVVLLQAQVRQLGLVLLASGTHDYLVHLLTDVHAHMPDFSTS